MNNLKLAREMIREVSSNEESQQTTIKPAVDRRRYYFFDAKPENAIKFTAIKEILSGISPEKDATLSKLQGGNTGRFFADYFIWKKIAIVSNDFSVNGKTRVVYEVQLSPFGTKISGSERVTPTEGALPIKDIELKALIFNNKRGNSEVINVEQSEEAIFIDAEPPENIAKILLGNAIPAGVKLTYSDFVKKYDEYRIWVPNLNKLTLPDMSDPKTDDVAGGHYPGGEAAYNKYIKPLIKESPSYPEIKKPSLKEKVEDMEKNDRSPFKPVEKSTEPVKGDIVDNVLSKTAKVGDYATEPYSGGTDVLQRLVKDQRKHMNIRKVARKMVIAYLRGIDSYQSVSSPAMSTPYSKNKPSISIEQDVSKHEVNRQNAEKLRNLSEKQEAMNKQILKTQKQMEDIQKKTI